MNPETLDLLENVLSFSLWPEPLRPVTLTADTGPKAWLAKQADSLLQRFGLRLCFDKQIDRECGTEWPVLAHTMIGRKRLRNIRDLAVAAEGIEGSWVECGVWRGGASIYAAACMPDRTIYLCDSFEGMPDDPSEPNFGQYDNLKVNMEEVWSNFKNYGLWSERIKFVPGWFKDSLRLLPGPIAILRCDGDLYSSTMQILGSLYEKVSIGGYVIIDDWNLVPCRDAVRNFCEIQKIHAKLVKIDECSVYWRKE